MTQDSKNLSSTIDFSKLQQDTVEAIKSGKSLTGKDGVLTPLIKQILEASLEGEMQAHLENCEDNGVANRRNGKSRKQVKSEQGIFELETPRDREGSFEPQLVKKRQTVFNASLDNKILGLSL